MTDRGQQVSTELALDVALQLYAGGAESERVVTAAQRVGQHYGLERVELALTPKAVMISSWQQGQAVTLVKRLAGLGQDMHKVCQVELLCERCEQQELSLEEATRQLNQLDGWHWPRWAVALAMAPTCGAFAWLMGADLAGVAIAAVAAIMAMALRLWMTARGVNLLFNWAITAFVSTFLTRLPLGLSEHIDLVSAAVVLMLVPGFPMVDALTDMLRSHFGVGWARWVQASLMILAAAVGVASALHLLWWLEW
ncbi:threonine/serine exporter family protein [Ferrimonas gelatinilytica]|uniref:Threonine/serine exporter ThrE family protein n=1 Tax=Ferrimonas gelatinilytica TaxID=1255257 RepID=A0ABP9S2H0_9GAMM